jgi:hypothetical protein
MGLRKDVEDDEQIANLALFLFDVYITRPFTMIRPELTYLSSTFATFGSRFHTPLRMLLSPKTGSHPQWSEMSERFNPFDICYLMSTSMTHAQPAGYAADVIVHFLYLCSAMYYLPMQREFSR